MITLEKITDQYGTYWVITRATVGTPNRIYIAWNETEAEYLASR